MQDKDRQLLEKVIRLIIAEDEQGFLQDIGTLPDRPFEKHHYPNIDVDPLMQQSKESRTKSRTLKSLWNKHADHAFMSTLLTVHWVKKPGYLQSLLTKSSHKDELATSAYLPGSTFRSNWGGVGLLVKGRITFAANVMDFSYSGYHKNLDPATKEKFKSSGLPRRPGQYVSPESVTFFGSSHPYIFDRSTFEGDNSTDDNEAIVDNWQPRAIIINPNKNFWWSKNLDLDSVKELAKDFDLPVLDATGKKIFG